jgi:hypothetical protein
MNRVIQPEVKVKRGETKRQEKIKGEKRKELFCDWESVPLEIDGHGR